MLDFNHVLATPGYDLQEFYGQSGTTLLQWQTWRKPRGVNWVYMIGVGGGGGGSTGGRGAFATAGRRSGPQRARQGENVAINTDTTLFY